MDHSGKVAADVVVISTAGENVDGTGENVKSQEDTNDDVLLLSDGDDISEDNITVIIRNEHRQPEPGSAKTGKGKNGSVNRARFESNRPKEPGTVPEKGCKKKRKNISGAEKNRRRKAREALLNSDPKPQTSENPGTGVNKRGRSPNPGEKATPPPKRTLEKTPPVNRPKEANTFKEVVADSLTHYIIGANESLTADQVEAVMGNVVCELEKFFGTGQRAPSFNGNKAGEAELELRCADDRTVSWLKQIVPKLKPWRKSVPLRLVTKSEWEAICKPKRMLKMSVFVPWRTTGSYFMEVLRSNNPELKTKYWEIKNTQNWYEGTKLILRVDEVSVEILRAKNWKAFWLLDFIEFKLEKGYRPPAAAVGASQSESKTGTTETAKERNVDLTGEKRTDEEAVNTSSGTNQPTTGTPASLNRELPANSSAGTGGASSLTRTGTSKPWIGDGEVSVPEEEALNKSKPFPPGKTAH